MKKAIVGSIAALTLTAAVWTGVGDTAPKSRVPNKPPKAAAIVPPQIVLTASEALDGAVQTDFEALGKTLGLSDEKAKEFAERSAKQATNHPPKVEGGSEKK